MSKKTFESLLVNITLWLLTCWVSHSMWARAHVEFFLCFLKFWVPVCTYYFVGDEWATHCELEHMWSQLLGFETGWQTMYQSTRNMFYFELYLTEVLFNRLIVLLIFKSYPKSGLSPDTIMPEHMWSQLLGFETGWQTRTSVDMQWTKLPYSQEDSLPNLSGLIIKL